MSDVDREAIELGIASIGEFDIDNCTCDASVGFYPCHYCAEREAILAGKRVLERLAAAQKRNECPECGLTPGATAQRWCDECVGEIQQRLAAAEAAKPVCEWSFDYTHDKWDTTCGNAFTLLDGSPEENEMRFCPFCGGNIHEAAKAGGCDAP